MAASREQVADLAAAQRTGSIEVVALVTSAGGLDALTRVLRDLPSDFPAAVVIAQHLGGQASTLVNILRRRTLLPVDWAEDGRPLRAAAVTVRRPRSLLEILPDRTCSIRPSESAVADRPLDALLTSVGDSFGGTAVAVVLTGMGTDGATGAATVHAAGGVVIAQSEESAEQPAMPRAAVAAGAVDLVLPLHDIGRVLIDVVAGKPLPRPDHEDNAVRQTFGERGEVARLASEIEWRSHPLGPVHEWPSELRQAIRFAVDSPAPVSVYWGHELYAFFNDGAIAHMGGRHTEALGGRQAQVFPEAWIGGELRDLSAEVMAGRPTSVRSALLPRPTDEGLEDAWWDLHYTPIRTTDGVAGFVVTVFDRTDQVLAARRLETINRVATTAAARGRRKTLEQTVAALDPADTPFVAAYLLNATGSVATLVTTIGVGADTTMAPREESVLNGASWPLRQAIEAREPTVVGDVASRFRGHVVGPTKIGLETALVHPLWDEAEETVVGVLIVGANPRLAFDGHYRDFLTLVGETVSRKVAESHARQREHLRLERLAELDAAKTEFFSNVSHEFRTPLTLMLGPLDELLHDGRLAPEPKADLVLIHRSAQRLLRLVGTLLDFSQIEGGRLRAQFTPVDLATRTREIVAQFESAVARAGLRLRVELEDLPEPVWVDLEMWEKIVSNLVSNALKFTFEGEIEVTMRALPKHAELVVRDTGVGIPEDELPHIFKRFHRVRGTRARTSEGAGIGLALIDQLVRRHHGRIRATSALGQGTTFTVWIPLGRRPALAEPPLEEPPPTTAVAAAMAEEAMQWGQATGPGSLEDDGGAEQPLRRYAPDARIVVADDNKDMRDYLARLLAPHWRIETASDGTEALRLTRENAPDLVLADVMMPGLDGFALLRELRDDPILGSMPVVLVTARAGEEAAIEGLLAGADDYIVKPFSARELVARVGGQLELARARRHAAELNAFRVGLSDALRDLSDPVQVQNAACQMVVEQLGADRARFVEIDEAAGLLVTQGGYAVGEMPEGFGCYKLEDYAPLAHAIVEGRRLSIEDTESDPYVSEIREALIELEIGAQLVIPLVREGGGIAALAVHQRTARRWTDEEIAIAEEVAGRTWAEVERARAEAALRESEERMQMAIRATRMVTWEWVPSEDRITTSDSFAGVYGLPSLSGAEDGFALVLPEDEERHLENVRKIATDGGSYNSEFRIQRPDDGRVVWLEERAEAQVGPDGNVERVIGVTLDVTERKRSEEALLETEKRLADHDRLRSMVNIPGVGVLTWEPSTGRLIDANDAFLEMSGYTREQIESLPMTWRYLTPEEQHAESERQMHQLADTGRLGPYEKDLIRADGSRSRMLYAGAAISDQTVVEYCIDLDPRTGR
jgi:PAS domain S-box-containing protein